MGEACYPFFILQGCIYLSEHIELLKAEITQREVTLQLIMLFLLHKKLEVEVIPVVLEV